VVITSEGARAGSWCRARAAAVWSSLGFRVQGSGFRVLVESLEFRV
jgi:hypothetical protein